MKFINRKFVWLSLSLVLFSLQANAQEKTFDDSVLSENGKQAHQTLLKVEIFAIGGTGYSGSTSDGEKALDTLLEENNATDAFKYIAVKATPEGGLYALFGLRMLDCECFADVLNEFKKLPELSARKPEKSFLRIGEGAVAIMSGCMMLRQSKLEVAEEINNGEFDSWIKWKKELKESKKKR